MLIDSFIGKRIVGIHIAHWETNTCNNADYIYELDDGRCFRMPDFYLTVTDAEICIPDTRHSVVRSSEDEHYHVNLFGRTIVDILIPRDPEIRHADAVAIKLDSGYHLMQESGAPQGIIPSVFLIETIDSAELQSVFETNEWLSLMSSKIDKATEPSDLPKSPFGREFES